MLEVNALAEIINQAIGATDKNGLPIKVTEEMKSYAKAIITITQASIAHTTGTVTGKTAPGAPLTDGEALNGTLIGFVPQPWIAEMTKGFPSGPEAMKEAVASVSYLNGAAKINFTQGSIVGQCTNTAEVPGPLVAGAGTDGVIEGLSGSDWAKAVVPPIADPALSEKIYTAIVNYIVDNIDISYPPNTVTGVCPPADGTLEAGTAAGGIIK